MKDTVFFKQAELLLKILPLVYKEEVFALKGGTAINFFVRDLPRISVDIDLSYLPVNDRDSALNEIRSSLLLISEGIRRRMPGTGIIQKRIHGTDVVRGFGRRPGRRNCQDRAKLGSQGVCAPARNKAAIEKGSRSV